MEALRRADLTRFFRALARRLPCRLKVILTGGSEALLLGGTRPTRDVDFGVVFPHRFRSGVEEAIARAAQEANVAIQYSEDIDRWSAIAIPARRFGTKRFRRFGRLSVHLLDPACWAVYKLARYLDSDVEDLTIVLRRESVPSLRLARLCGESLRSSPRSPTLFTFRRQVEHFFREHGPAIWGRRFDADRAIGAFHRSAGIAAEARGL